MELYMHNGRNVVVREREDGDKWYVKWVSVNPAIEGKNRRGRRPNFSKAVKAADCVLIANPNDKLLQAASAALAAPAEPESTETTSDAPEAVAAPEQN